VESIGGFDEEVVNEVILESEVEDVKSASTNMEMSERRKEALTYQQELIEDEREEIQEVFYSNSYLLFFFISKNRHLRDYKKKLNICTILRNWKKIHLIHLLQLNLKKLNNNNNTKFHQRR